MSWEKIVAEVGPLLGSILGVAGLIWLKAWRDSLTKTTEAKKETTGLVSVLETDERITEFITELRVNLNADRVHFSQPHNGEHFASMFPVYKLSRTHETCKFGISYRRKEMTAVRVSEITSIISPVLLDTRGSGMLRMDSSGDPCQRVIGFDTFAMQEGYEKFFLESMLIKFMVMAAVWIEGDLYGFIGVDFCTEDPAWDSEEFRSMVASEVMQTAEKIGYVIKEGKKKITSRR